MRSAPNAVRNSTSEGGSVFAGGCDDGFASVGQHYEAGAGVSGVGVAAEVAASLEVDH